jgi:MFS family permease
VTKESGDLKLAQVIAVAAGNALEFYDFLTFSFFAVQIGHAFFPAGHALLLTLATFGVGFLTRPLGGLVIGGLGDRVGRKPAMILSFSLMGASIVALALIPPYAAIGVAAPILLVVCRLVQGFALGGEVGPSTAFLIEAAPAARRGFYVSLQYMTQDLAVLAAGVMGFVLSNLMSAAALDAWGWRLAFLLGAAIAPVGLMLRRGLPETLDAPGPDAAPGAATPLRLIVLGLIMMGAVGIYIYGLDYVTTYAQDSLRMTARQAFGATVAIGLGATVADPLAGLLTDRLGRKPVMLAATGLMLVAIVPAFLAMIRLHSVAVVLAVSAVLAVFQALIAVPALVILTESLPKAGRSRGLGLIYAVALAAFGGATQFTVKALTDATANPLAPAWYMTAALALGAAAMVQIRETGRGRGRG